MSYYGGGRRDPLPFGDSPYPWTLRLLAINGLIFVVQLVLMRTRFYQSFLMLFALQPATGFMRGMVWQIFTYMFLHGGFLHILFNMFVLWMFGREVEMTIGRRAFLRLYLVSGLVAGLCSLFMWKALILGASGAVLGVLAAYGVLFPDRIILAFLIIPMKVRYFVWLVAALDIFGAIQGGGSIAHLAHIGGLASGYVLMKTGWYRRSFVDLEGRRRRRDIERQRALRRRVDEILDKVNREGLGSLTREEREFLEKARRGL
ncbi:MAG: rhomboid family intramembrane serine protease [Candidatus Krumholzibacteriota bacterium]|nr:rhomboid family intramembrane serine protease [Candidatus Krumholzibacteriota bacterium]